MKKLFAVVMTLALMISAVAAFAAEGSNVTTVNWSDHEAEAAKLEGRFATVADTGLKMYIPAEFKDASKELSQENIDAGHILLKSEKDEKAVVSAQVVPADISSFVGSLQKDGKTVWEMRINGLIGAQFSVEKDGVTYSNFAFGSNAGTTLLFSFGPVNAEPYTSLYKVMVSSIQSAQ